MDPYINVVNNNNGGVIVVLFLMATTIAVALFGTVTLYERSTSASARTAAGIIRDDENSSSINSSSNSNYARLLRLLSGWANIGNSIIHILLVMYMLSNTSNESEYWVQERKLGGIEGPVGLAIINFVAGMAALRNDNMMKFPLVWNSVVAVLGTTMPVVWPRFLQQGIDTWPYIVIFIWFVIFVFELAGLTCSVAHHFVVVVVANDGHRSESKID